jgi:hypothetical protein
MDRIGTLIGLAMGLGLMVEGAFRWRRGRPMGRPIAAIALALGMFCLAVSGRTV